MVIRNREFRVPREEELVDKIFQEARALAATYEFPHYIWRALDNLGVREKKEQRRLFPKIRDRIARHHDEDRESSEKPDGWVPKDIFSEEGREWMIEQARAHLLEYPDPEEFERNWDE